MKFKDIKMNCNKKYKLTIILLVFCVWGSIISSIYYTTLCKNNCGPIATFIVVTLIFTLELVLILVKLYRNSNQRKASYISFDINNPQNYLGLNSDKEKNIVYKLFVFESIQNIVVIYSYHPHLNNI